jgi:hypothetical protein
MSKRERIGTIYRTDGRIEHVTVPPSGRKDSLPYLQGVVGGLIELVKTFDGRDMWINEEGKLEGLPANANATAFYKFNGYDVIVGDAIVIGEPRGQRARAYAAAFEKAAVMHAAMTALTAQRPRVSSDDN